MYNLASNRYYAGDLPGATQVTADGVERARSLGMTWSVYGVELHMFTQLIRYVSGDLTPAHDRCRPGRAGRHPESPSTCTRPWPAGTPTRPSAVTPWSPTGRATGSSRWSPAAAPSTPTRGAASSTRRSRSRCGCSSTCGARGPTTSWAASGWSRWRMSALADAAAQERLLGRDVSERVALGDRLLERASDDGGARPAARRADGPRGAGVAGARARRALAAHRGQRRRTLWRATVAEFDYGYRYEVARSRFRLAEALLEAGDRDAARDEAGLALTRRGRDGRRPAGDRRPGARATRPAGPAGRPGRAVSTC